MSALRTHMHRHVLHHTQNGHAHFFKHFDALSSVQEGNVLRRGHNDRARERHTLAQGQLNVASAWGHVDQ